LFFDIIAASTNYHMREIVY